MSPGSAPQNQPAAPGTTAVLLMAYGAVSSVSDLPAYLTDIRRGRPPTPQLLREITERYELMGGRSPLLDITRQQADAVEKTLHKNNPGSLYRLYIGMRHWNPTIQDAVSRIIADKIQKVVAICLTPYYSRWSVGAYFQKLEEACVELKAPWARTSVESWNTHPLFVQALAEKISAALPAVAQSGQRPPPILFSAHSLPARIIEEKDPYPRQLQETIQAVMKKIGPNPWYFAYQSQGRTGEPWLGPDAAEVIRQIHQEGHDRLLMAPIGFISDHMETLYDVDILHRKQAEALGMRFARMDSLNTSSLLIDTLADLAQCGVKSAD